MTAALVGTLAANAFYLTLSLFYFFVFAAIVLATPIASGRDSRLLSLSRALDVHLVDDRLWALPEELAFHRHSDDLPVEPERPVVHVPRVELEALRPRIESRPFTCAQPVMPGFTVRRRRSDSLVVRDLFDDVRARAHEAHLAAGTTLNRGSGGFVQARAPEEVAGCA